MLGLAFLCVGCQDPLRTALPEARLLAKHQYILIKKLDLPEVAGSFGCGAEALGAVMGFLNPGLDPQAEAESLPWHDTGATPIDILLRARAKGYGAKVSRGTWSALTDHVQEGLPVLVMFDRSVKIRSALGDHELSARFHWAVVSGIGLDDSEILIAAPAQRHIVLDRIEFMERWSKCEYCTITLRRRATNNRSELIGPAHDEGIARK